MLSCSTCRARPVGTFLPPFLSSPPPFPGLQPPPSLFPPPHARAPRTPLSPTVPSPASAAHAPRAPACGDDEQPAAAGAVDIASGDAGAAASAVADGTSDDAGCVQLSSSLYSTSLSVMGLGEVCPAVHTHARVWAERGGEYWEGGSPGISQMWRPREQRRAHPSSVSSAGQVCARAPGVRCSLELLGYPLVMPLSPRILAGDKVEVVGEALNFTLLPALFPPRSDHGSQLHLHTQPARAPPPRVPCFPTRRCSHCPRSFVLLHPAAHRPGGPRCVRLALSLA